MCWPLLQKCVAPGMRPGGHRSGARAVTRENKLTGCSYADMYASRCLGSQGSLLKQSGLSTVWFAELRNVTSENGPHPVSHHGATSDHPARLQGGRVARHPLIRNKQC